jgi:DNA ligase-1
MTARKPMKGDDYDESQLAFPLLASPKVDGFRAYNDGGLCTSSGKPFMNVATREYFGKVPLHGLDGEMIVGRPDDPKAFAASSGPLRRGGGDPKATWLIFDDRTFPDMPYMERLERARVRVEGFVLWNHTMIRSLAELESYEQEQLARGFEGVMIRSLTGPYKFGRSTVKEGYLLKVKRHITAEAEIIGFEELMHNDNEAFKDELGRTKRSDHAENLRPSGMIGSFIVKSKEWPTNFKISAGSMTHEEKRAAFLAYESEFHGKIARYSYFPYGVVDVPRHGIFDGIRPVQDL